MRSRQGSDDLIRARYDACGVGKRQVHRNSLRKPASSVTWSSRPSRVEQIKFCERRDERPATRRDESSEDYRNPRLSRFQTMYVYVERYVRSSTSHLSETIRAVAACASLCISGIGWEAEGRENAEFPLALISRVIFRLLRSSRYLKSICPSRERGAPAPAHEHGNPICVPAREFAQRGFPLERSENRITVRRLSW